MSREITLAELKEHNTEASCWVAVAGKVYALPEAFVISDHPGGAIIMEVAGSDGTAMFEDQGHSEGAMTMLNEKFLIGVLKA